MKDEHDLGQLLKLLKDLLPEGSHVNKIEYLPGGYSNRNYRIECGSDAYVLRVCRRVPENVDAEINYLSLDPAPQLVGYQKATGNMVTRLVNGPLLVDHPFSPEECSLYLKLLHQRVPLGIRSHDPVRVTLNHFDRAQVNSELQRFVANTSWKPRNVGGCHNDLNAWNIIREPNGNTTTLDWEFAGDNEPLFDVVNLCYGLRYPDESYEECSRLYSLANHDSKYLLLTRLVFLVREHAWALAQIATGNDRSEIRNQARDTEREFRRLANR